MHEGRPSDQHEGFELGNRGRCQRYSPCADRRLDEISDEPVADNPIVRYIRVVVDTAEVIACRVVLPLAQRKHAPGSL